jgi:hypothetical protein
MAEKSVATILVLTGVYVGVKLLKLYAAKPVPIFNSVIAAYVAPIGTVTVILVEVEAVITALVAPKNTILLLGVVWKPVPVMVTTSPGLALVGANDVIAVWAKRKVLIKRHKISNTEILLKNFISD